MKRQLLDLALRSWICLWSGCSATPLVSNAGHANQAILLPASSGSEVTGVSSAATMRSPVTESTAPGVVEPRIALLVERTLDGLSPARVSGKVEARSLAPRQRRLAGADYQSVTSLQRSNGIHQRQVTSDRVETLRVTDAAGDFCAAVTIASQLAVTALHCVRMLCESAPTPIGTSLLGCRVNYESPNGTTDEATVVATSENDLLALLDLHRPQPKYGALCCDDPRADDRVYTVSHPGGENWLLSFGWLTRDPIALEWIEGQATRVLVAEIPTKPGSSGGGLFDVQDRLVGIQIARWSPWTTDFGKAAFIQASRIFNLAGRYCMQRGSSACVGLRCTSWHYDVWNFNVK